MFIPFAGLSPVKAVTLVTVSGSITYQGHPVYGPGEQVGFHSCTYSGFTVSSFSEVDRNGHYSFQIPAGCRGEFQVGGREVPALGIKMRWNGTSTTAITVPASGLVLDFEVPKLVALELTAKDTSNTPLAGVYMSLREDEYWPRGTQNASNGQVFTTYFSKVLNENAACFTVADGTCTLYVPQNVSTTVRAVIGNRWYDLSQSQTVITTTTDTATAATRFQSLETIGSQGSSRGLISILAPEEAVISSVEVLATDLSGLPDASLDLTGTIQYTVSNLTPGASITMKFVIPEGDIPTQIYKWINGMYIDVSGIALIDGRFITLALTDGGIGDVDGLINGVIVDPVLAVRNTDSSQSALNVKSVAHTPVSAGAALAATGGSGSGPLKFAAWNGTATGCTVTGSVLTANSTGTCKVVASKYGSAGYRLATSPAQTVTFVAGALSAPRNLSSASVTGSTLVLSWDAPISDGGSTIVDYKVEQSSDGGKKWSTVKRSASTNRSLSITQLAAGSTYHFRVSSVTAKKTSAATTALVVTTVGSVPPSPTTLKVLSVTTTKVTLAWTQPTVVNGSAVRNYIVEYSTNGGSTWTVATKPVSTSKSATISGFRTETTYLFRVKSVNDVGASGYSNSITVVTR